MEWTPEALVELRRLWDRGDSATEIGKQLKCSKNCVCGKRKRLGLPERRSPLIDAFEFTPDEAAKVIALHSRGYGCRRIAQATGLTRERVRTWMRRHGLEGQDARAPRPWQRTTGAHRGSAVFIPKRTVSAAALASIRQQRQARAAQLHEQSPTEAPGQYQSGPIAVADTLQSRNRATGEARYTTIPGVDFSKPRTIATTPGRECQYPFGDPGSSGFRFCCDDAIVGKPYCQEHAELCYHGFGQRAEMAA